MTEKEREARNCYYRAWRKANPEKVRAIQTRYWAKKADELEKSKGGKYDDNDPVSKH